MIRLNRWFVTLGISCIIIFLVLAGLLRPLGDLARMATLPLVRAAAWAVASIAPLRTSGGSTAELTQRIQELERKISTLAVDYTKLHALEEENRLLRAQAKFLASSGYDSVGARVISRDVLHQRGFLVIDRGLDDHVEVGEAVLANDGIFIGKIILIKEQIATVQLLSDPGSRVAASLAAEPHLIGIVEGRGNGAAALNYVPSSEVLKRDQIIVTAGTEEKVPGQLPLGIVNAVEGKPTDPFLSASIEPLVHFDQIVFVSVLRPTALRPKL
jgi:rod shape-determining protein MreC